MADEVVGSGEDEGLRECYHAFLARRMARGDRSIRTRRGFGHLRASYQPHVRFLLEQADFGGGDDEASTGSLKELVEPYIDTRVLQFITDVCWPLAHFGPQDSAVRKQVAEWQELPSYRYFDVMVSILLWMFPGLPSFEVQELMERDWQNDRDFDPYGNEGLSLEGFIVSFIDLAVACTNGNTHRCIEFLKLIVDRLENSLGRVNETISDSKSDEQHDTPSRLSARQLKWFSIPLNQLMPCKPKQKPEYYELKAKASTAPMVLMVLSSNEKPFEFQLSSSSKLLVRERDSRTSIRRKTIALKAHLIELEKQILWTLRDWSSTNPSLILIPSTSISQRALKLYACIRLLDSHEQELHTGVSDDAQVPSLPPLLTLYSSIQDPIELIYRAEDSNVGRIERMGSQLFVLDHRERQESFVVSIKSSLLHSTNAAGGIGAAAIISSAPTSSTHAAIGDLETATVDPTNSSAHTFVFVVKDQREFAAPEELGVHRQNGAFPQQWFCSMSAADESKTITIHAQNTGESSSPRGLYYLYIFSLHGMYYEVVYHDGDGTFDADEAPCTECHPTLVDMNQPINEVAQIYAECNHSDEELELAEVAEAAKTKGSGAVLLRCLLKLRQKRNKKSKAEPLPSFIEGVKVEQFKTVSAAVTLRSKFLKAREIARHSRILEREQAFADNLKQLLMRHSASFKRGPVSPRRLEDGFDVHSNAKSVSKEASVDNQVQLIAEFFREMAIHAPSEADNNSHSIVNRPVDEQLLREFGDLFERDSALLNILDEEKWETEEIRAARTATMLQDKIQSQMTGGPQLVGMKFGTENLLHEDYMNTATYIEELMRAVAEEEQSESKVSNNNKSEKNADQRGLHHLQASWAYAQHRAGSADHKLRHSDQDVEHLESQRRDEWMKSHYITDLAGQARLSRPSSPVRTPMTLSKTAFDHQREQLPWDPTWEIQLEEEVTANPKLQEQLSPATNRDRPRTTSSRKPFARFSYQLNEQQVSHGPQRDETAVKSASLSYAHRLRIERVRSAPPTQSPRNMATRSAPPSRPTHSPRQMIPHVPSSPRCGNFELQCNDELDISLKIPSTPHKTNTDGNEIIKQSPTSNSDDVSRPVKFTPSQRPPTSRRVRRGQRSKRETPMRQRVKDLLSMSEIARQISLEPEKDDLDKLFPASSDLPIPTKVQPCPPKRGT